MEFIEISFSMDILREGEHLDVRHARRTPYNDYVQPSAGGEPQHLGEHHMGKAEAVR